MEAEWSSLKLLITGASGLFGSKLAEIAALKGFEVYSGYNQDLPVYGFPVKFDISDRNMVKSAFSKVNPDVVVHAATLTDVDKCEVNKEFAWKINVEGTKNIVEAAKKSGTYFIYISTDYVFNGEKGFYNENDVPDPINFYGLTKLNAEELVKSLLESCCIVRPSVIYGSVPATGKVNFALWLIQRLSKAERVRVVTDQYNSPTLNTSLAEMTIELINRRLTGFFHLSGATRISRYDFGARLAEVFGFDRCLIDPVSSTSFNWPAKRPADSSLDTSKAVKMLSNKPLEIMPALHKLKNELNLSL